MYSVIFSKDAAKQMTKLDKSVSALIYKWVAKHLDGIPNPRTHGKALVGDKKGRWRYRVGSYRLLADIQEQNIVIVIVAVGHRSEVYKLY
jgi:mRNA interferase RelE/StbE